MTDSKDFGFATRSIHAGAEPDPTTGARSTPIVQSTAFVFNDADHAAAQAPQGHRPLGSRSRGAPQVAARRLYLDVVGQERAHVVASHAVALLPACLRCARRDDARIRPG